MGAHILLAEDDATARRLIADVFQNAGYTVNTAADGAQAIAMLSQAVYDVVVSDIWMPGSDGISVLAAARQLPRPPAVILLTGYSTVDSAIEGLRAGAFDYRLKSAPLEELLASVTRAVAQRRAELEQQEAITSIAASLAKLQPAAPFSSAPLAAPIAERPLQIGQLSIDLLRHAAFLDQQPLHLTSIEFSLLRLLAQAPGQVFSYQAIIQRTHGFDTSEVEAQVLLKPHVHRLRRKLGAAYVINVRGSGYALAPPDNPER
jgi:DNA-binding response OmpR family regulator